MQHNTRRLIWYLVIILLFNVILAPVSAQDSRPLWDGQSRFTVLVMGIDRRPGGQHGLSYLTDVLMLVNVDPATRSVGVLRLPRDLHLARVDSDALERVNSLLTAGENLQEGYGPYLVMDTIQYNLGIYIDAYIIFDFQAFTALIDFLGGIDVDVPYSIYDANFPDMNYGYDPFSISVGQHHMDGYTALRYVRTRHADNDFYRGERQLQVLFAVRERVLNLGETTNLLAQAPVMLAALEGNLYTDLMLREMLFMAQFAIDAPAENIFMGAVADEYVVQYRLGNGPTVYIPNRELLGELMVSVFGEGYWE